jgi:hypothetical protein
MREEDSPILYASALRMSRIGAGAVVPDATPRRILHFAVGNIYSLGDNFSQESCKYMIGKIIVSMACILL